MTFFTDPDPDFSGSDFWPIRIRTQKKSLIRIRGKKPDPKQWIAVRLKKLIIMLHSLSASSLLLVVIAVFWMSMGHDNSVTCQPPLPLPPSPLPAEPLVHQPHLPGQWSWAWSLAGAPPCWPRRPAPLCRYPLLRASPCLLQSIMTHYCRYW